MLNCQKKSHIINHQIEAWHLTTCYTKEIEYTHIHPYRVQLEYMSSLCFTSVHQLSEGYSNIYAKRRTLLSYTLSDKFHFIIFTYAYIFIIILMSIFDISNFFQTLSSVDRQNTNRKCFINWIFTSYLKFDYHIVLE